MFELFKYNEINITGWLRRQLKIQAEGLAGNLDRVWPDVRDSAWIGGSKEGWERVPYWLDGFVPLAFLLRDSDLISRAERYLNAIMGGQQEDGWICPCAQQDRDTYDVWALFLICKVLSEYGMYAGNKRAIGCVYKAMKNLYERMQQGSTVLFQWGKYRWFEAMLPLNILLKRGNEPWMAELGNMLRKQGADYSALADSWKRPKNAWSFDTHIVNLAMMLKYEAVCQPIFCEPYQNTAEKLFRTLYHYNGTAVGTFTGDECLSGISPIQGTELCAAVELMYSCETLFAATGDPIWADRLEKIAFNALPAATSEDMWSHQYVQMENQIACVRFPGKSLFRTNGPDAHLFGLEPNYGCCTANFGQGWPKLAHSIFMKSENGIVAALPLACTLHTEIQGTPVTISAEGEYPFGEKMCYTVSTASPLRFELKLRIPSHCRAIINGKLHRGRYIRINKNWNGTETIEVLYRFQPKLVPRPNRMYYAEYGPLVFVLPLEAEVIRHEYTKNGVERKFPYCDYELLPKDEWAFGFSDGFLKPEHTKVSQIPFSEKEPPVVIKTTMLPVKWDTEDGYETVCAKLPTRIPQGGSREMTLIPYGCSKLRMTQMPKISPKKNNKRNAE